MDAGATEIKDTHLLTCKGIEGAGTMDGSKEAVVRKHDAAYPELTKITHQQRYITQRVVFTFTSSPKVGYIVPTLFQAVARSLCLVVILLFINANEPVVIFCRHAITIPHNSLGIRNLTDGTITGNDMGNLLQYSKRNLVGRKLTVCNNNGIELQLLHTLLFWLRILE